MRVNLHSVFPADVIQVIDALLILFFVVGVNLYDCVQRFPAGVHKDGNRQVQLPDQTILCFYIHGIRLYQRISEVGHILIVDAVSIQRVEPYPCAGFLIIFPDDGFQRVSVFLGLTELLEDIADFLCVYSAVAGHPLHAAFFVRFLEACNHISEDLIRSKQCFQVP